MRAKKIFFVISVLVPYLLVCSSYRQRRPAKRTDKYNVAFIAEMKCVIEKKLDGGHNINGIIEEYGMRPLEFAVYAGDVSMVKKLLGDGANKKLRDFDGFTPGQIALLLNHRLIFKILEPGKRIPSSLPMDYFFK